MPCWADNNGFIIYLSQKVNVDEFRQIIKVLEGKKRMDRNYGWSISTRYI